MKNVYLLLIFITLCTTSFAQKRDFSVKFIATSSSNNGVNTSSLFIDEYKTFSVLYQTENDGLYFANVCENGNSQSWGPVYNFKQDNTLSDKNYYRWTFSWNYKNSYDDKKGTCKCSLDLHRKAQGIISTITIVTEELDVIVYKGYVEGTLDFSVFE